MLVKHSVIGFDGIDVVNIVEAGLSMIDSERVGCL